MALDFEKPSMVKGVEGTALVEPTANSGGGTGCGPKLENK